MIRKALIRYDEIEMSAVPEKEDIDFVFSQDFERRMRQIIEEETKSTN